MRHRTGILKWWLIGLLLSGLLTGLWAIVANADGPSQSLAVLTFENDRGDDATGALLTDLLAERLSAAGQTVVDRAELGRVLVENKLTLSGLAAGPERDAATGKLVGARLLLSGRLVKLGDARLAAVRLLRVADARAAGFAIRVDNASPDAIADRISAELGKRLPELTRSLNEPAVAGGAGAGTSGLSVAVLNFTDVAADAQGSQGRVWLGKALSDLTIGDLVSRNLRAVSREQMQEMVDELHRRTAKPDDRPDQPNAPEPAVDPREVAKVLKAARCVHGSFELTADGKARLTASLLDVTAGPGSQPLHQVAVEGAEADLLTLQKRLAAELADVLTGARPGTTDAKALPRWTESLSAAELLYRGVDRFDRGEYLPAWALFRRALKIDPAYADARYWTGRMMYYVQEYDQARIDLVRFVLDAPRHQRAGDAVLELVNSAQQTAVSAAEFVAALDLAAAMAPDAEVANQYGPGSPSTVAVYAASLAAQALQDRDHPERDEALMRRYAEAIARVPRESPLYWVVWHDMFALKVSHARSTGVLLPLPPTPLYLSVADPEGFERAKKLIHPDLEIVPSRTYMVYGGIHPAGDQAPRQEFVHLTPDKPTFDMDFGDQPLVPRIRGVNDTPVNVGGYYRGAETYTRYFYSGADRYLAGLEFEIRYRQHSDHRFSILLGGDVIYPVPKDTPSLNIAFPLDGSGVKRIYRPMPHGPRVAGIRMSLVPKDKILEPQAKPPIEVLGWTVTARFTAQHQRREAPRVGRAVEPWQRKSIGAYDDTFRMGNLSGDSHHRYRQGIDFLEDRDGRWIVVWYLRHDLYLAISTDHGATWSPPRRLSLPVNSAHDERCPRLSQDSKGRYVLAFCSDRGLARGSACYVCWSENLDSFSAPAMISPDPAQPIAVRERSDGTYLAYLRSALPPPRIGNRYSTVLNWSVAQSSDLVHWTAPQPIERVDTSAEIESMEQRTRERGGYHREWIIQGDVAVSQQGNEFLALERDGDNRGVVKFRTSQDGIRFSLAKPLPNPFGRYFYGDFPPSTPKKYLHPTGLQYLTGPYVSFAHDKKGGLLAIVGGGDGVAAILRYAGEERWEPVVHNTRPARYGILVPGITTVFDRNLLLFEIRPAQSPAAEVRGAGILRSSSFETAGVPLLMNTMDYTVSAPQSPPPPGGLRKAHSKSDERLPTPSRSAQQTPETKEGP